MADQHSFSCEKACVNTDSCLINNCDKKTNDTVRSCEADTLKEIKLHQEECNLLEDNDLDKKKYYLNNISNISCLVNQNTSLKQEDLVISELNLKNTDNQNTSRKSSSNESIPTSILNTKNSINNNNNNHETLVEELISLNQNTIDKEAKIKKDKKKPFVCRFFLKGICNRGENCEYLHEKTQSISLHQQMLETECPYFKFGLCHSSCSFRHTAQEDSLCPEILPEWYLEFLLKKKIDRIFEDSESMYLVEETSKLRQKVLNSNELVYSKQNDLDKNIKSINNASNTISSGEEVIKPQQVQNSTLFNIKHESIINLLDNEKTSYFIISQEDMIIKTYLDFSVVFLKNPSIIAVKDRKVVLLIFNSTYNFFLGFVELIENGKIYDKNSNQESSTKISFPPNYNYFMEIVWLWEWRTVTQKVNYLKSEGVNLKDLCSESLVEKDLGNKLCKFMMKRLTKEETVDLFKRYLSADYNDSLLTFNNIKDSKGKNISIPSSISKCLSEIGMTNLKHGIPGIPLPIPNIDTQITMEGNMDRFKEANYYSNINANINLNINPQANVNVSQVNLSKIPNEIIPNHYKQNLKAQTSTVSSKKALLGIKGLINKDKPKNNIKIELDKSESKDIEVVLKLKEEKLSSNNEIEKDALKELKDSDSNNNVNFKGENSTSVLDKHSSVVKNLESSTFNLLPTNMSSNLLANVNLTDKHSLSSNLYSEDVVSSTISNNNLNNLKKEKHSRKRSPSIDHREIKERKSRHRKRDRDRNIKTSKEKQKDEGSIKDNDKDKDKDRRHKRNKSRSRSRSRSRTRNRSRRESVSRSRSRSRRKKRRSQISSTSLSDSVGKSDLKIKRRDRSRSDKRDRDRKKDRNYQNTNKYYIKKVYNNNLFYYNSTNTGETLNSDAKLINNAYSNDTKLNTDKYFSLSERTSQVKYTSNTNSNNNNTRHSNYSNNYNSKYSKEDTLSNPRYFKDSSSNNWSKNNNYSKNSNFQEKNTEGKKEEPQVPTKSSFLSMKRIGSNLSNGNGNTNLNGHGHGHGLAHGHGNKDNQTILVSSKLFSKALSQIKDTNC